jgi:hypothetical protein
MDFNKISKVVSSYLKMISLDERVEIFNQVFNYKIKKEEGLYVFNGRKMDGREMSDYLEIEIYWLSVKNTDKLYEYILNNFERI